MHLDSTEGAGSPFIQQGIKTSLAPDAAASHEGRLPSQIALIVAENHELRAEVERLRTERARMCDIQNRLMEAVGCKSPDRLVHDVRNVLNERELYRALADTLPD
jgi:hypothetical protein